MDDYRLASGDQCNECGAWVPDYDGGGMTNKHHDKSCSLYEPTED